VKNAARPGVAAAFSNGETILPHPDRASNGRFAAARAANYNQRFYMSIPSFEDIITPNDQTEARKVSLEAIAALVGNVYPNKFARSDISGVEDTITALKNFSAITEIEREMADVKSKLGEGERPPADVKDAMNARLKALGNVRIAGRVMTPLRGNFVHLTDGISKLQIYCKKGQFAVGTQAASLRVAEGEDTRRQAARVPTLDSEDSWTVWTLIDHGDFIGVEGYLFLTNTGEVSVHVERLQFLAKAMLPMPDKMHGIADAEIRQRQRYYDLIGSSLRVESHESRVEDDESAIRPDASGQSAMTTRQVFETRAKVISSMRHFLEDNGYIEVETPMLTPKATGAAARPFKTHHNALDIDLYARIAPELYLKRLVVGGFEKVYELNRNFRNEGISHKHNPEFTMLEFYCAYMDVNGMMDFCEHMMKDAVQKATGGLRVRVGQRHVDPTIDCVIDFSKFERLSMKSAVYQRLLTRYGCIDENISSGFLDDLIGLRTIREFILPAETETISSGYYSPTEYSQAHIKELEKIWVYAKNCAQSGERLTEYDESQLLLQIFEEFVEPNLIQPTFIIDYPKSISPLSKASPNNPQIAERFELFINGMEVANGFSELNDPKEQYERFVDQMSERERGDEEAMVLDEDYIRALSYGMPPAAGIGIGIDRLVMLLTNKHSIRDVILFPHMRPEKGSLTTEDTENTEEN